MPRLCTTCNVNLRMYGDKCRRCHFKANPPKPRKRQAEDVLPAGTLSERMQERAKRESVQIDSLPEDSPLRRLQERAAQGLPLREETQTEEQEP